MVLEKALESPLDCKEIKSVNLKEFSPECSLEGLVLKKTLESPLDSKEIKLVNPKINPEYSLEGLMLKLKLQNFGHLMPRTDSLEKILMLGKIEGRKRWGRQRMT